MLQLCSEKLLDGRMFEKQISEAIFAATCGARIAQLVVCGGSLSCLMQRRGFDLPLRRIFYSRGDFSLGRRTVTTSMVGLKKWSQRQKSHP